jgi:hypothetical protein
MGVAGMPPLSFFGTIHDIPNMKIVVSCALLAAAILAWSAARADECTSQNAQALTHQGYAYLDQRRWNDARTSAGELALYVKNCNDPSVQLPSVVHSAYIGAVALHHLGDDTKASEAAQMGMTVLDMLHENGGYEDLYKALQPKFAALQAELKT